MNKRLAKLIGQYQFNAEGHGLSTSTGDYKRANLCHDNLLKILCELKGYGEEGSLALLYLTDDKDESVRCWSATHSLKFNEEKAKRTLIDLQSNEGIIAFNAEMVLEEWRCGNLEIP